MNSSQKRDASSSPLSPSENDKDFQHRQSKHQSYHIPVAYSQTASEFSSLNSPSDRVFRSRRSRNNESHSHHRHRSPRSKEHARRDEQSNKSRKAAGINRSRSRNGSKRKESSKHRHSHQDRHSRRHHHHREPSDSPGQSSKQGRMIHNQTKRNDVRNSSRENRQIEKPSVKPSNKRTVYNQQEKKEMLDQQNKVASPIKDAMLGMIQANQNDEEEILDWDYQDFQKDDAKNEELILQQQREARKKLYEDLGIQISQQTLTQYADDDSDEEANERWKLANQARVDEERQELLRDLEQYREREEIDQTRTENEDNLHQLAGHPHGEEFDMFALDDIPLDKIGVDIGASGIKSEDCADTEGYYKLRLGEILNGHFKILGKLGKGVYGSVVKAQDLDNDQLVALKILRNWAAMRQSGQQERAILETLNESDPNDKRHIVRLLTSFEHKRHLCLAFELFDMNLREALKYYSKNQGLSLDAVRSYGVQLFVALQHLRKHKIIHADLKPDNIILSSDTKTVKLCDLGTAFPVEKNGLVEYLVSRYYRAPEIILGYPYDMAIDVWSLACTLYELYTGKFLFNGRNNNQLLYDIMQKRGKFNNKMLRRGAFVSKHFDESLSFLYQEVDVATRKVYIKVLQIGDNPVHDLASLLKVKEAKTQEQYRKLLNFKDLLEKCLALDPKNRCTPEEALHHQFLDLQSMIPT